MLHMKDVSKVYRTEMVETHALRKLSLEVRGGEFVAVTGPSGSGKTTFLNIAGLLEELTGGTYTLDGVDVKKLDDKARSHLRNEKIGFVFQSFNLIDELTVYENVELPLVYAKTPARERHAKVDAVLERMDIGHRRDHLPGQLSGGQQQRVAVARAVVHQPRLLLADEPTGNLDSEHGAEVMKILVKLHEEGTSILMVTHSADNAAYAERIVRMLDGRILADQQAGRSS
jgi:putative ABC transport system ATP-binding protein